MSNNIVIKTQDVNVENITYANNVKTLDNGGKMVWMGYSGRPLIMQLPTMKAPFGVSEWSDEKTGTKKYYFDLSFDGMAANEELAKTYEMFKAMDAKVLNDGMDNSMAWFKKRYTSIEIMDALFSPSVKMPKDEKYSPTIKLPLAQSQGEFKCGVFDGDRNRVNILDMNTKGAEVTAIIQLVGIWLAGGKFGVSWKVQQLRIIPRTRLTDYAFLDDDASPQRRNAIAPAAADGLPEEVDDYDFQDGTHTEGSDFEP